MEKELAIRCPTFPSEIISGKLWLGPAPCRSDGEIFGDSETVGYLSGVGITHVVNCTPEMAFPTPDQLPLAGRFRVPVDDVDDASIEEWFDGAADYIQNAIINCSGRVYVHCETGKSRSAAIVLAYRVKYHGESLRVAYNETKKARDYIQPKHSFFSKLAARELEWNSTAAGSGTTSLLESPSFSPEDYALVYLQDHFQPYSWAGVTPEVVEEAFIDSEHNYDSAFDELIRRVQAAMF